jgi:hypothetical protein
MRLWKRWMRILLLFTEYFAVTPYSPVDAVYEVENGVTMDLEA